MRQTSENAITASRFMRVISFAIASVVLGASFAYASDVDTSVVDATSPTGAVTIAPGYSGVITINFAVSGNQAGTATFSANRDWSLAGGAFSGSNPATPAFTVAPQGGGTTTNFSTTGTVAVDCLQAPGDYTLQVGAINITNSNATGAKLVLGDLSNYTVKVLGSAHPSCNPNTAPTVKTPAADASGDEGSQLTTSGEFQDANADDVLTITKDSGVGDVTDNGDDTWSWSHTPSDDGGASVTVKATDPSGLSVTDTFTWTATNAAPGVTIDGAPTSSPEGTQISLSATVSDPGTSDTHTYAWSVTKGGVAYGSGGTGPNFSFTPNDDASYVVAVTATDDDGGVGNDSKTISVENVAPSGTIGTSPANIDEGGSTTLSIAGATDASSVDGTSLRYQFACTGALPAPSYAAASPSSSRTCSFDDGPATPTLRARVIDKDGGYTDYYTTIGVANVAPSATFDAPATVNEGSSFQLSHTNITDPSTADAAQLTHAFDCGAGFGSYLPATSRTCTTSDDAVLSVGGKVQDKNLGVSTYGATVTVLNVNPTASIGGEPASSPEGTQISLTGGVTDPGADTHTYEWTVTKDGEAYTSGITQDFSFTPDDNGTYLVSFVATDDDEGTGSDSASITVTNVDPASSITDANDGPEGTEITLGHGAVTDPGADTHSFTWAVTKNGDAYASGTGASFSFTPDDNGTYGVTMTVTDDDGGTGQDTASIEVTNVDPELSALGVSGAGGVACTSNSATLSFTASDAVGEANDPLAGSIDWGDGSIATPFSGRTVSETHSYAPGTYTIQVSVGDDDDGTDSGEGLFARVYRTSGFLQPINAAGTRSSFKLGSTIPVKVRVYDCNDTLVTNLLPDVQLYKLDGDPNVQLNELAVEATPTNGKEMRWAGTEYIYNLSTKLSQLTGSALTAGTYRIKVVDPAITTISADVDLRR